MAKKIILLVLCVLMLCFIWGNSVLSTETSVKISSTVGEMLAVFFGEGDATETVGGLSVRKMGHFVEYFALGVLMLSMLTSWFKGAYVRYSLAAFSGLFVPFVDETIQIFSGRGSSLRDVWIDVGGYACGVALACAAFAILKGLESRVKNNNKK